MRLLSCLCPHSLAQDAGGRSSLCQPPFYLFCNTVCIVAAQEVFLSFSGADEKGLGVVAYIRCVVADVAVVIASHIAVYPADAEYADIARAARVVSLHFLDVCQLDAQLPFSSCKCEGRVVERDFFRRIQHDGAQRQEHDEDDEAAERLCGRIRGVHEIADGNQQAENDDDRDDNPGDESDGLAQ